MGNALRELLRAAVTLGKKPGGVLGSKSAILRSSSTASKSTALGRVGRTGSQIGAIGGAGVLGGIFGSPGSSSQSTASESKLTESTEVDESTSSELDSQGGEKEGAVVVGLSAATGAKTVLESLNSINKNLGTIIDAVQQQKQRKEVAEEERRGEMGADELKELGAGNQSLDSLKKQDESSLLSKAVKAAVVLGIMNLYPVIKGITEASEAINDLSKKFFGEEGKFTEPSRLEPFGTTQEAANLNPAFQQAQAAQNRQQMAHGGPSAPPVSSAKVDGSKTLGGGGRSVTDLIRNAPAVATPTPQEAVEKVSDKAPADVSKVFGGMLSGVMGGEVQAMPVQAAETTKVSAPTPTEAPASLSSIEESRRRMSAPYEYKESPEGAALSKQTKDLQKSLGISDEELAAQMEKNKQPASSSYTYTSTGGMSYMAEPVSKPTATGSSMGDGTKGVDEEISKLEEEAKPLRAEADSILEEMRSLQSEEQKLLREGREEEAKAKNEERMKIKMDRWRPADTKASDVESKIITLKNKKMKAETSQATPAQETTTKAMPQEGPTEATKAASAPVAAGLGKLFGGVTEKLKGDALSKGSIDVTAPIPLPGIGSRGGNRAVPRAPGGVIPPPRVPDNTSIPRTYPLLGSIEQQLFFASTSGGSSISGLPI